MRRLNLTFNLFNGLIFYKRFITLVIIFSLSGSLFAQTRRAGANTANNTKPTAQKCSGVWTGSVKYTLTQTHNESKTEPRFLGTVGEDTKRTELKYEYTAKVVVAENAGKKRAKAVIDSKLTGTETTDAKEKVSCDQGKTWKTQSGNFVRVTKVYGKSDDADASVTVGVNADGTYNVAVGLPQIRGESEASYTSTFSGQCREKKGENEKMPPTETSIQGNSLISDGSHRLDPKNPNRLSGSYTRKGIAGMEETISWKLQRCGSPLMITEVELFQPVHPSINNWVKIEGGNYTIDGNFVKVVAKIANVSGETKTTPIEFREMKENTLLPGGKESITIAPNEEKEIVYMWDTSGYAWKESGELNQPEINRQIEVKITDDVKTENVEVRPKPVIVIPGLWSDKYSFSKFMSYFENQKSARWAIDYARIVTTKSAAENASEVEKRIKEIQERTNAWHVDLVGHSTGGLAGRVYINNLMGQLADGKPTVTNFVMVGTPNKGTPCSIGVDTIFSRFFNRSGDAFREITYKNMQEFNSKIKARKGTKFYGLVGHGYNKTCHLTTPGDGLVPAGSALWLIKNFKYTPATSTHEFLLGEDQNMKVIHQWLAISPKGDHKPEAEDYMGSSTTEKSEENFAGQRNYGAMFHPVSFATEAAQKDDEDIEPTFGTGVKLDPNQTMEIEIPVPDGKRIALNMLAPKKISATLIDPNGTTAGTNLAGTPEAENTFRLISVEKPFQKSKWKLRLESRETEAAEIAVVVFVFQ